MYNTGNQITNNMNYEKNVILEHLLNMMYNLNNDQKEALVASINHLDDEGIDFAQLTNQSRVNLKLGAKFLAQLTFPKDASKYYDAFYKGLVGAKIQMNEENKKIHGNSLD